MNNSLSTLERIALGCGVPDESLHLLLAHGARRADDVRFCSPTELFLVICGASGVKEHACAVANLVAIVAKHADDALYESSAATHVAGPRLSDEDAQCFRQYVATLANALAACPFHDFRDGELVASKVDYLPSLEARQHSALAALEARVAELGANVRPWRRRAPPVDDFALLQLTAAACGPAVYRRWLSLERQNACRLIAQRVATCADGATFALNQIARAMLDADPECLVLLARHAAPDGGHSLSEADSNIGFAAADVVAVRLTSPHGRGSAAIHPLGVARFAPPSSVHDGGETRGGVTAAATAQPTDRVVEVLSAPDAQSFEHQGVRQVIDNANGEFAILPNRRGVYLALHGTDRFRLMQMLVLWRLDTQIGANAELGVRETYDDREPWLPVIAAPGSLLRALALDDARRAIGLHVPVADGNSSSSSSSSSYSYGGGGDGDAGASLARRLGLSAHAALSFRELGVAIASAPGTWPADKYTAFLAPCQVRLLGYLFGGGDGLPRGDSGRYDLTWLLAAMGADASEAWTTVLDLAAKGTPRYAARDGVPSRAASAARALRQSVASLVRSDKGDKVQYPSGCEKQTAAGRCIWAPPPRPGETAPPVVDIEDVIQHFIPHDAPPSQLARVRRHLQTTTRGVTRCASLAFGAVSSHHGRHVAAAPPALDAVAGPLAVCNAAASGANMARADAAAATMLMSEPLNDGESFV